MTGKVRVTRSTIPGVFTILNFFFGFLAILMAAQHHFVEAAWLILGAALFDGLDGELARLLGTESRFGIEFDSMADLVSFCTAPAVLIYFAYVQDLHPILAASISLVPLIGGGFRLSRYNIQTLESPLSYFVGLSCPAQALTVASFILFNLDLYGSPGDSRVALPLVFILSFLMVSRIRYPKIPASGKERRGRAGTIALLVVLAAVVLWKNAVLFPLMVLYVSWGLVETLVHPDRFPLEPGMTEIMDKNTGSRSTDRNRHRRRSNR